MARATKVPRPGAVSIHPSAVNGQCGKNGIAMDFETLREPAAAGEPVPRAQASSLDIGGQRTRDLQKRRKRGVAVEVDRGFPGTSRHRLHSIKAESDWSN
jgi:hypothetical protein